MGSFSCYRLLKETDGQSRSKRKMNVYKLSANQDTLMQVVDESLSVRVLNVSRMEIKENRQRINDLLMLIGSVEDKVINMSNHLEQEIRVARTIVVLFSRLNTLIGLCHC